MEVLLDLLLAIFLIGFIRHYRNRRPTYLELKITWVLPETRNIPKTTAAVFKMKSF